MKALVVYESMWGNTERVARAVAEGLARHGTVEVREVSQTPSDSAHDADLLVVGGPTHAFSMSRGNTRTDAVNRGATQGSTATGLREWLAQLESGTVPGSVAVFDTRVEKVRRLPGSAAKAAAKVLKQRGLRLVTRPQSFYVVDMGGPLLDGEAARARLWGEELARAQLDGA